MTTELAEKDNQIKLEEANMTSLKTKIAENETDAVEIQTLKGKALKELERYAFSRVLAAPAEGLPADEKDAVLEAKIATARQNLDNIVAQAKADSSIEAELRKLLTVKKKDSSGKETTVDYYEMLENHRAKVTDFETYDDIQGLLSGYASELGDKNSKISEEIRRKQDEERTLMANANAEGKK